jgi:diaminopropionate ammonia-lyase
MAGLRCAEPSHAAWPTVRDGVDAFVSIPDSFTMQAMERLASTAGDPCIEAGPSGACGVGALLALASEPMLRDLRDTCRLGRSTRMLAIATEGK